MKNLLSNIFEQIPFGLYITDDYIQVLQFKGKLKKPIISAVGQRKLPEGCVENGKIIKKKELSEEIIKLMAETKPAAITGNKCILALPGSQTFEHAFYLEKALQQPAITTYLNELIEGIIPLSLGEIKYNFSTLLLDQIQVAFVTAIDKKILKDYKDTLKEHCDLELVVIEPESLSLGRNIPLNLEEDTGNIFMKLKNGDISWYLVWKGKTFDSNCVPLEKLSDDLNKSIKHFEGESKRKVNNMVIFEKKEIVESILKSLHQELNAPMEIDDKYTTEKSSEEIDTEIVKGAALRGFDLDNDQINLA